MIGWAYFAVGAVVAAVFFRPIVLAWRKELLDDFGSNGNFDYAMIAFFIVMTTLFAAVVWPLVLVVRVVYLLIKDDVKEKESQHG